VEFPIIFEDEKAMELMRDGVSLNQNAVEDSDSNDVVSRYGNGSSSPEKSQEAAQQTIVLQPANLIGAEGAVFQASFNEALQQAAVILLDLIWLDEIDAAGLAVLLAAMKAAYEVGVTLSFLSMDASTRQWLDAQWEQDNAAVSIGRDDVFAPEFEQFLADYQARKEATLLAVEIASTRQW
jgi:anti-anti-sigma regulatory factor